MPQMDPMNWMLISLICSFSFMLILSYLLFVLNINLGIKKNSAVLKYYSFKWI